MKRYKHTDKEIIAIMKFTGFTRQESIDYLIDLREREDKMIISMDQRSKALDQLALLIPAA